MRACDQACARKGINWDTEYSIGEKQPPAGFFRDLDLTAFSASLPPYLRESLLSEAELMPQASLMVCASTWKPESRTLILHQGRSPGITFLEKAVPLCRVLSAPPVVLTLARTENRAIERQELAREVFYRHSVDADFDLIAGCELQTAVVRAAQARGCSRVILEREPAPSWWHRLRGDTTWRLLSLADKLTIISLCTASQIEKIPDMTCEQN
jgi:K+-sensing histidine kinase KdpD